MNQINEMIMLEGDIDENNVFVNVKILGQQSSNGYSYDLKAMEKAVPLYENAPVYLDHGKKNEARPYSCRVGYIKNARLVENDVRANFVMNPHHERSQSILWDAKNGTPQFGFSHSISGNLNSKTKIVESIDKVFSVDLVNTPATTKTIFENFDEVELLKNEIISLKEENKRVNEKFEEITNEFKKLKAKKPEALGIQVPVQINDYETFIKKLNS